MKKAFLTLALCSLFYNNSYSNETQTKEASRGERIYDYHPETPLALGKGVNRYYPLTEHLQCIERTDSIPLDSKGAVSTQFTMKVLNNFKQLQLDIGMSASLSAMLKFAPGGSIDISTELEKKFKFHDDTVTIMIKAESDYGRFELEDFKLKENFQALIDEGKHEQFAKMCGTDFVIRERKKALVAAFITIHNVTKAQANGIRMTIGGGASESTTNKSINGIPTVGFNTVVKKFSKIGKVSLKFMAFGGNGISDLGGGDIVVGPGDDWDDYLGDIGDNSGGSGNDDGIDLGDLTYEKSGLEYDNIQSRVTDYMAGINQDNAPPVRYYLASMSLFGHETPKIKLLDQKILNDLYYKFLKVEAIKERLQNKVYKTVLNEKQSKYYKDLLNTYTDLLDEISETATSCMRGEKCKTISKKVPAVKWTFHNVKVKRASVTFHCWAPGRRGPSCGAKPTFFGGKPNWNAALMISGEINGLKDAKKVLLVGKSKSGRVIIQKNLSIKTEKFSQKVLSFSASYQLNNYYTLIDTFPNFELHVVDKSGKTTLHEIGAMTLKGRHLRRR